MSTALYDLPNGKHQVNMAINQLQEWNIPGDPRQPFADTLLTKINDCDDLSSSKIKAIWEVVDPNGEWQDFLLSSFRR